MQSAQRLFRSAALERLSSPERLDTLMEVTTLKGWLALVALVVVVVGALVWGVLGRIPQVITGSGIMVREGGLYRVQTTGGGEVDSLLVRAGARVRRGQVIAMLAQPELRTTIRQLEGTLGDLRRNREGTARLLASTRTMELQSIEQQQHQADEAIAAAQQRLQYLDARIASEKRAVERGLMTPDAAEATVALRSETQLQMLGTAARKRELAARAVQLNVDASQTLFSLDQRVVETQQRLDQARQELAAAANVESPYDGVVVEQLVDAGQKIAAGTPVATVEPSDVALHVLMFIPLQGKRIGTGMRVEMVPGGVHPEETGYFLGTVRSVSAAPISGSALDRYLKNEVLVQQFTREGGAYVVDVAVEADRGTVSGFRWTSGAGAPLAFGSGTLLDGRIVVATIRPIAMIVPALRKWLGV